jgi:hypothetical protein
MEKLLKIRRDIIKKIEGSEDVNFLKGLNDYLEMREQGIYELSQEQQNALNESREQIARGEFVDNDILFQELEEWLQKK